jgi:hypothetical protein
VKALRFRAGIFLGGSETQRVEYARRPGGGAIGIAGGASVEVAKSIEAALVAMSHGLVVNELPVAQTTLLGWLGAYSEQFRDEWCDLPCAHAVQVRSVLLDRATAGRRPERRIRTRWHRETVIVRVATTGRHPGEAI